MKILLISNIFPPGFIGGYELGALDVAADLATRGHEVLVLTSDYFLDDELTFQKFTVERSLDCVAIGHQNPHFGLPAHVGQFVHWRNIRKVGSAIRRFGPDVVVVFNAAGIGSIGLYHFLSACKIPYISYFMDNPFQQIVAFPDLAQQYNRIFGELRINDLGRVIAMSYNLLDEMETYVSGIRPESLIIPGWVSLPAEEYTTSHSQRSLKDNRPTRFVFSGQVAQHKGIFLVVDAVEKLVRLGRHDFVVDIYGPGSIGPIMQEVHRRDLSNYISYLGTCSKAEMVAKFGAYDALLFPTWEREPYGFTASEAAGRGCIPIITSRIGAAEWFIDSLDCLKIQRNVDSLLSAMRHVMEMSDSRLERMKSECRSNVRRSLEISRWMNRIEEVLMDVGASKPLPSARHVSQIESSFLVLSEQWLEA